MLRRTFQRAGSLYRLWRDWCGVRGAYLALADDRLRHGRTSFLGATRGQPAAIRVRGGGRPFDARIGLSDLFVIKDMFIRGEYDDAISRVDPRAKIIVDLGSNIGASIRLFAARFPDARILAVEPDAENARLLELNASRADKPERIAVVRGCVAAKPGVVRLELQGDPWAFKMESARVDVTAGSPISRTVDVPAYTLDQLLTRHDLSGDIDLLKCDIEGAEREVFAASAPWIGRVRCMAVELHDPYTLDDFAADVRAAGGAFQHHVIRQEPGITVLVSTRS